MGINAPINNLSIFGKRGIFKYGCINYLSHNVHCPTTALPYLSQSVHSRQASLQCTFVISGIYVQQMVGFGVLTHFDACVLGAQTDPSTYLFDFFAVS